MEKIAVCSADMTGRRRAGSSPQDHLPGHKFSVVFTERAVQRFKARIGTVGARRPLPAISEELLHARSLRRRGMQAPCIEQVAAWRRAASDKLPFRFGRETA